MPSVFEEEKMSIPLLRVSNLRKYFPIKFGILGKVSGYVKAVDGVTFEIGPGEVLSLVGESGSGKTTIAKNILLLEKPTSGSILFDGQDITKISKKKLKEYRRKVQAVFQNPFLSLDPRMSVYDLVSEPLMVHMKLTRRELRERVIRLLEMVGLDSSFLHKFPHELSGGQAQRVAIARAAAVNPKLLILDEPTSALDVSVQAQILNLLAELKGEMNLSYLLITHDLSIVRYISDKTVVIYLGKVMEKGPTEEIFKKSRHPYTQVLLSSIPDIHVGAIERRITLKGEPPSPINPPSGCRFHTRCPYAMPICGEKNPPEVPINGDHVVACWLYAKR